VEVGAVKNPADSRQTQWPSDTAFGRQQARVAREHDAALRRELTRKYNVPPEFLEMAVAIWYDGKYD
jgi:hypothetical protein